MRGSGSGAVRRDKTPAAASKYREQQHGIRVALNVYGTQLCMRLLDILLTSVMLLLFLRLAAGAPTAGVHIPDPQIYTTSARRHFGSNSSNMPALDILAN